ncbi:hypothetical protein GWN26_14095, partial [Candidatus Saccharibacteria bacterium]|nr:hypothetical protein [Candidatus Saccharibacteria bacterium]NIW79222.1 hypothetical protein [Calditrichia bacterium]
MSTILVVNEIQDNELKSTNFETLTAARQLGDQINQSVTALLFGTNLDNLADKPGQYGADNTILVEDEKFEKLSRNCYSAAIAEVAKQKDASVVLMAASFLGKDIMSRAAQLLETSLAQDCISFRVNGDQIYFTRP